MATSNTALGIVGKDVMKRTFMYNISPGESHDSLSLLEIPFSLWFRTWLRAKPI